MGEHIGDKLTDHCRWILINFDALHATAVEAHPVVSVLPEVVFHVLELIEDSAANILLRLDYLKRDWFHTTVMPNVHNRTGIDGLRVGSKAENPCRGGADGTVDLDQTVFFSRYSSGSPDPV
ncbi:MAG TPA: hypothetical protein VFU22_20535 [Roseiflexaceae bacterium]|nr:hypothetical protein [Roseiflexaceae bacterium]